MFTRLTQETHHTQSTTKVPGYQDFSYSGGIAASLLASLVAQLLRFKKNRFVMPGTRPAAEDFLPERTEAVRDHLQQLRDVQKAPRLAAFDVQHAFAL